MPFSFKYSSQRQIVFKLNISSFKIVIWVTHMNKTIISIRRVSFYHRILTYLKIWSTFHQNKRFSHNDIILKNSMCCKYFKTIIRFTRIFFWWHQSNQRSFIRNKLWVLHVNHLRLNAYFEHSWVFKTVFSNKKVRYSHSNIIYWLTNVDDTLCTVHATCYCNIANINWSQILIVSSLSLFNIGHINDCQFIPFIR